MSKEKMTYEQALEIAEEAKNTAKAARIEFKAFCKDNKIKSDEAPADEKLAKKWNKLKEAATKATASHEEAEKNAKALKPKVDRQVKYSYPEGLTPEEKKKFRTKMRAEKKRAEKEATKGEKSEKGSDKEEKTEGKKKEKVKKTDED